MINSGKKTNKIFHAQSQSLEKNTPTNYGGTVGHVVIAQVQVCAKHVLTLATRGTNLVTNTVKLD